MTGMKSLNQRIKIKRKTMGIISCLTRKLKGRGIKKMLTKKLMSARKVTISVNIKVKQHLKNKLMKNQKLRRR